MLKSHLELTIEQHIAAQHAIKRYFDMDRTQIVNFNRMNSYDRDRVIFAAHNAQWNTVRIMLEPVL